MIRVVIATGDEVPVDPPDDPILRDALLDDGVDVEIVSWRRDHDWVTPDAVVIRSTWDIVERADEFRAWLTRVAERGRLVAAAPVVAWNLDKRYLLDLEGRGVPIVPTVLLGPGDDAATAAAARGWDRWLTKPAVGAGAIGIRRGEGADPPAPVTAPTLLQPFVPAIADGEVSVVTVDGVATHAVRKIPADGDFRVQVEHGGRDARIPLDRELIAAAERAVDAVGPVPVLARVDLVAGAPGWELMELELIEPQVFLDRAPEVAPRLARAVAATARVRPGRRTDPETELLLAVRLRSRGHEAEVAETARRLADRPEVDVAAALAAHEAAGRVRSRGTPARWSLTPAGEAELAARLAIEADTVGRDRLTEAYEAFLPLNRRFLALVAAHERGIDGRDALAGLVGELDPVLDPLRAHLYRFEGYRGRFARAVGRAGSDPRWLAAPGLDSVHTVWFELHEQLLATLGRDRTLER